MRINARHAMRALITLVLALPALGARAAPIDGLALDINGPTNNFTNLNWSLGWRFTTNTNVNVTGLCFYDDFMNGIVNNHEVSIYDTATQALIVHADVFPGDPLAGVGPWWRCHPITPVLLPAGGDFVISASTKNQNYTWNPATVNIIPQINYIEDRFTPAGNGGQALFPDQSSGNVMGWFGPTFQTDTDVPEGNSVAMLLSGLPIAFFGIRRMRCLRK